MKVLLFSDLHLDRVYPWAPPAVGDARRQHARNALVAIVEEARRRAVDLIAIAGDLFDRDTTQPSTVRWLMSVLDAAAIPVLVAPGDDDWLGPRMGYTQHDWPGSVTVFDEEAFRPYEVEHGLTVWGAGHRTAVGGRPLLGAFRVDRGGTNIALFHASLGSDGAADLELDRCRPFFTDELERAGFQHALVGHYPRPRYGELYTYSGAALAHRPEDGPNGGVAIVEIRNNGSAEVELVPLTQHPLHDVAIDITGVSSVAEIESLISNSVAELTGIVRLTIHGSLQPGLTLLPRRLAGLARTAEHAFTVADDVHLAVEVATLAAEPTVRGEFVRQVQHDESLSPEQRKRVLALGLRALDGADHLEVVA
jgi:DNA repair exonuclease SbcCD nuclease subunit